MFGENEGGIHALETLCSLCQNCKVHIQSCVYSDLFLLFVCETSVSIRNTNFDNQNTSHCIEILRWLSRTNLDWPG